MHRRRQTIFPRRMRDWRFLFIGCQDSHAWFGRLSMNGSIL
jgi:hypothetical protein